jgi:hypothetical protein
VLQQYCPSFGEAFAAAWKSDTLKGCPTIIELRDSLLRNGASTPSTPPRLGTAPPGTTAGRPHKRTPTPPPSPPHIGIVNGQSHVSWKPIGAGRGGHGSQRAYSQTHWTAQQRQQGAPDPNQFWSRTAPAGGHRPHAAVPRQSGFEKGCYSSSDHCGDSRISAVARCK